MERLAIWFAAVALSGAVGLGCTPSIGDKCVLSTDCSLSGDRLCDTSQPDGYCTIFDCRADLCPDYGVCAEFHQSVQGCNYNDRMTSRTGHTFCLAQCKGNSDCRDGYVCADVKQPPWNARILDDYQLFNVCVPTPGPATAGTPDRVDAPVCRAGNPPVPSIDLDGGVTPPDAAVTDTGADVRDADAPDASDASDAG